MPDEHDDEPRRIAGEAGPGVRDDAPVADDASQRDELLSMLVDGELDAQEASSLRERIASEPALAERLASFERVGAALRALPAPQVPADLAARMRAKLAGSESALELESTADSDSNPESSSNADPNSELMSQRLGASPPAVTATATAAETRRRRSAPPLRRRRLWTAAAGLSAAAALALYLAFPSARPPSLSPQSPVEVQTSLLASAGDDELGIALYYDELLDLEMLEQFELLEILAAIEEAEQG